MQRALLQYKRPENHALVRKALHLAGREDLIGYGGRCLVPPAGGRGPGNGGKGSHNGGRPRQDKRGPQKNGGKRPAPARQRGKRT